MNSAATSFQEAPQSGARKRVGTLVGGRWHLQSVLGEGGMATVYGAVHYRNGRRVALKILHEELVPLQGVKERFFQEAYLANRVEHRGVVKALDDGVLPEGIPFLVMEYLEGSTCHDMASKNPRQILPAATVCTVVEQVLDTLEEAHRRGIVHRDIKPDNIFVTSENEVKVLDFGIATIRTEASPTSTQPGTPMGTPAFMSPEQARGRWDEVDGRSDLFSLGASMYTLLSGCLLHEGVSSNEVLLAAMTQRPGPLREIAPHVPAQLAAIVDRALSFSAEDRFACAAEMKAALVRARLELPELIPEVQAESGRAPLESIFTEDQTGRAVVRTGTFGHSLDGHGGWLNLKAGLVAAAVVAAAVGYAVVPLKQLRQAPQQLKHSVAQVAAGSERFKPIASFMPRLSASEDTPLRSTADELSLHDDPIGDDVLVERSVDVEEAVDTPPVRRWVPPRAPLGASQDQSAMSPDISDLESLDAMIAEGSEAKNTAGDEDNAESHAHRPSEVEQEAADDLNPLASRL